MRTLKLLALAPFALALACGGGGSDNPPATPSTPDMNDAAAAMPAPADTSATPAPADTAAAPPPAATPDTSAMDAGAPAMADTSVVDAGAPKKKGKGKKKKGS